jgi:sec-independent protein translocase protein TatA
MEPHILTPLVLGLGVPELLIILAVVLLLFGGSRLAGLGKSSGRALKEFKEETRGLKAGEEQPGQGPNPDPPPAGTASPTPYQPPAGTVAPTPYDQPPAGNVTPNPYDQPPAATASGESDDREPRRDV